jgi:hypothetical protein
MRFVAEPGELGAIERLKQPESFPFCPLPSALCLLPSALLLLAHLNTTLKH